MDNSKSKKRKALTTALAVILAIALVFGGSTFAYLQASSDDVVNEFKTNQVTVDLKETTGNEYNIIPGTSQEKDPTVTVSTTVPAYVYVEVTDTTDNLVEYAIAAGWMQLDGYDNVYYREADADAAFPVLENNRVSYSSFLTNSDMLIQNEDGTYSLKDGITLSFNASAIQKEPFDDAVKGWQELNGITEYGKKIMQWDISANKALGDDVLMTYYDPSQIVEVPKTFSLRASSEPGLTEVETYEDGTVIITGSGNMESNVYNYFYDVEREQYDLNKWLWEESDYKEYLKDIPFDPSFIIFTGHGTWKVNPNSDSGAYKAIENHIGQTEADQKFGGGSLNIGIGFYWSKTVDISDYQKFTPTKLIIEEGVTNIPRNAFRDCSYLESADIPGTVKTIGNNAFQNCTSLKSINLSEGIQTIYQYAFGNTAIETMNIPDSVTKMDAPFNSCSSLVSITFPENITLDGSGFFANCTNLTSVTFPENIKFGANCSGFFQKCTNLEAVNLPDNFPLKESMFGHCSALKSVNIPTGITEIGNSAFQYCTNLTEIVIPDNITSIGMNAFEECSALKEISLSNNLTSIGSNAFFKCTSLTECRIPDKVKRIDLNAFGACYSLEKMVLGSSVTTIENNAFVSCRSLKELYLPNSIKNIYCDFKALPGGSVIYCQSQDVADKLTSTKINPDSTSVVVDASKF